MRTLLGQTIFSVGGTVYLWADVILAAELRGEWSPVVRSAMTALAALERDGASEEELVSDEEIEAESEQFRYAKDLVSVDDTERWISTWNLDVDAWLTWIRADLIRKRFEAEGAGLAPADPTEYDAETVEGIVQSEGAFSGVLARLAQKLAAQAAIAQRLAEDDAPEAADAEVPAEPAELPAVDVESLLPGFPPDDVPDRVRTLFALDRSFTAFRSALVSPEAVAARVRVHQGDWMRVDCRILTVASEDVAREALLSIQEDGEEMGEVAAGAGAELREGTYYLEELEKGLPDRVLAARKGELLGPIPSGDGWVLVEVVDKRLATVEDDEIRARAERSLFDSVVEREMDDRVLWRWGR